MLRSALTVARAPAMASSRVEAAVRDSLCAFPTGTFTVTLHWGCVRNVPDALSACVSAESAVGPRAAQRGVLTKALTTGLLTL